jgi:hypothetical protein
LASSVSRAVGLALALTGPLAAQDDARRVDGRVLRPQFGAQLPVAGAWVVLHRVGSDRAGPLDSVRSDAQGRFRFRYRPVGDTAAVYFASVSYAGVAYFTPPLRRAVDADATAEITVFDTASGRPPITVRGRHVIVSAPDSADRRTVVEIVELSNDSTVTRVASDTAPSWWQPLPDGATDVRVGEGDVSADAIAAAGGRVQVFAPLAPGLKQVSYSYLLPAARTAVTLPATAPIGVLEVLVEDPRGAVRGAGLSAREPVTVDGRPFRRFLAQDVAAGVTFTIEPGGAGADGWRRWYPLAAATALGAAMLAALAGAMMRRGTGPAFARRATDPAETLARRIVALDRAFAARGVVEEDARAEHARARAALTAELDAILAARQDHT